MLPFLENYGPYALYINAGSATLEVKTKDITPSTWQSHVISILNIFRDGIETEYVKNLFVNIDFGVDTIQLSIHDYFYNLIMWRSIILIEGEIKPEYIFFEENITKGSIKNYVDKFIINPNRRRVNNITLNNLIDDTLYWFNYVQEFSMYLANTINIEDDLALMNSNPEAFAIYNADMTGVPLDEIKMRTADMAARLVEMISAEGSEHCLADSFRAKEGVNIKQYKEFAVNIGIKPDGKGGVLPIVVNSSFINNGLMDLASYFVESSAGRIAQILAKTNVGSSGYFARLLGLNNSETILHKDPNYICNTKHFLKIPVKNKQYLKMLTNQYYRLNENGLEYLLKDTDTHLIGQTIYLRSPMCCASKARGEGVCYRCYGELAYTNNDINIGKMAAEILSAILTQMLLSAKHLLESMLKKIIWKPEFYEYFVLDANVVKPNDEFDFSGYEMVIDPAGITLEDEHDDVEYNESIVDFEIIHKKKGICHKIFTTGADSMYISGELNEVIRRKKKALKGEEKFYISMEEVQDIPLFLVKLNNNELSRTLNNLKDIIDKDKVTKSYDINTILEAFLDTVIEGNLNIAGVHAQIIIGNQIRDPEDILTEPRWEYPDAPYNIITLKQSLANHPSIIVTLLFERIKRTLYNPLTYRKNKASFSDLFFHKNPTEYLEQHRNVQ